MNEIFLSILYLLLLFCNLNSCPYILSLIKNNVLLKFDNFVLIQFFTFSFGHKTIHLKKFNNRRHLLCFDFPYIFHSDKKAFILHRLGRSQLDSWYRE